MRAKLRAIKEELRRRLHEPIPQQGQWLGQVVRGYFAYHAVPTNIASLSAFRYHVEHLWRRALRRRSQKDSHHLASTSLDSRRPSCLLRASFIRGLIIASPSLTQGGSPVRKSRTPGSVRGVCSNAHPYRDQPVSDRHGTMRAEIGQKRPWERFSAAATGAPRAC